MSDAEKGVRSEGDEYDEEARRVEDEAAENAENAEDG